jgi:hypothetical protein
MGNEKLYEDIGYIKAKIEMISKYFEKNGLIEDVRGNKISILWLRLFVLAILAFIINLSFK